MKILTNLSGLVSLLLLGMAALAGSGFLIAALAGMGLLALAAAPILLVLGMLGAGAYQLEEVVRERLNR
jgi:hypothetical protein